MPYKDSIIDRGVSKEEYREHFEAFWRLANRVPEPYMFLETVVAQQFPIIHRLVLGGAMEQAIRDEDKSIIDSKFISEASMVYYGKDFFSHLGIGKIMRLSEELLFFLDTTTPPNDVSMLKNPYPAFFINETIHRGHFFANGVLVMQQKQFYSLVPDGYYKKLLDRMGEPLNDINIVMFHAFDEITHESFYYIVPLIPESIQDYALIREKVLDFDYDSDQKEGVKRLEQDIIKLVANLLTTYKNKPEFLEAEMREASRERNEKRASKGKMPYRDVQYVRLSRNIHQYITYLKQTRAEYPYAQLVSGGWRTFRSERYTHARGKVKWVEPYIRGADKPIPPHLKRFIKAGL